MEFVRGWLAARDIEVCELNHHGRPLLAAQVGTDDRPRLVLHGHLDVVPARSEQFDPRHDGDRLIGRGAYDMKGAVAAMMCALCEIGDKTSVGVRLLIVCDEESDDPVQRATDLLVERGYTGEFAITGEPTDLKIGVQAKGVLALRIEVFGTAAHGSRPWLGDNAILKATALFERLKGLEFARQSTELFDRPSLNLGRIAGGDVLNKVPDSCAIDVDIRYLPGQDPDEILRAVGDLSDARISVLLHREPAVLEPTDPRVQLLARALGGGLEPEQISVGRDGASDAISFLRAGIAAVEFGPVGGGHHGPQEWVSQSSLERYRRVLVGFARALGTQPSAERTDAQGPAVSTRAHADADGQ